LVPGIGMVEWIRLPDDLLFGDAPGSEWGFPEWRVAEPEKALCDRGARSRTAAGVDPHRGPRSHLIRRTSNVTVEVAAQHAYDAIGPTVEQILSTYAGRVRFVFKNYPLSFHQNAQIAAEAGLAAHAQGRFWEMHDTMFRNQQQLTRPDLERYAQQIGLNMARFKADLDTGRWKDAVSADMKAAPGQIGTPTFFVNGRKISGALPFDSFKSVIDEELAKVKR
jgi:protein-disulfide isomerase